MIAGQMDVVHDDTAASMIDRISNLPNEIIHHILSFLDLKYAIQTSALSKRWKHIWTLLPHLNLNSRYSRSSPKFVKFVNDALSHRNHGIEVSAVELSFKGSATQLDAVVTSIVNYAYSHNVSKLTMVWFRFNKEVYKFRQRLFSCQTLKHLTLATNNLNDSGPHVPKSAWDFPALETLNLSNILFGGDGYKSLNLFSKCVNLKDLTLHGSYMWNLDIFDVCAPQLSKLTITDPQSLSKVFNVVAPKLESLTASVMDRFSNFLHLSIEDLDYLEKVNLSMLQFLDVGKYAPGLLDLFQKLCRAKFLILDYGIIKVLSTCLDQFSDEPCPFNNLKCLKSTSTVPIHVRNYFLGSSPSATFIMDFPQVLT
ncbi:hypothetical protein OSB04_019776 [Centaurea solstitialis]|uniref:F-box domain-containing protein n=1 Tax=Centaurea solstitialis TaxID=347529 RepID=A0AA38SYL8_9ASTR|nr:hypothetical protein OSB04_019776 [Centaurea solstitialis]